MAERFSSAAIRGRAPVTISVIGVAVVLTLISIGVARHPLAIRGSGNGLLLEDIALLLTYAVAIILSRHQSDAIRLGSMAGVVLGTILAANHLTELFLPMRALGVVIAPVLIALALLTATGSIVMERTGSYSAAVLAGAWCAIIGILFLLSFGFAMPLVAEGRVESWLQQPYLRSGMSDPGAFAVRNALEAASESLVRMPVLAVLLSLLGGSMSVWAGKWSRTAVSIGAYCVPLGFLIGVTALIYANSIPRSARPPLVLIGVLFASAALSAAYPLWSAHRRASFKGNPA